MPRVGPDQLLVHNRCLRKQSSLYWLRAAHCDLNGVVLKVPRWSPASSFVRAKNLPCPVLLTESKLRADALWNMGRFANVIFADTAASISTTLTRGQGYTPVSSRSWLELKGAARWVRINSPTAATGFAAAASATLVCISVALRQASSPLRCPTHLPQSTTHSRNLARVS